MTLVEIVKKETILPGPFLVPEGHLRSSPVSGRRVSRYLPREVGQQYYGRKAAFTFLRDPFLGRKDWGLGESLFKLGVIF